MGIYADLSEFPLLGSTVCASGYNAQTVGADQPIHQWNVSQIILPKNIVAKMHVYFKMSATQETQGPWFAIPSS